MSVDKQKILHDLNLKDSLCTSTYSTPLMFSRDSSMETLSSFNINFHSHNSTYTSEHSTNPSGILSPSDIPDSPPRGCNDEIDMMQERTPIQPLNHTRSSGMTVIERTNDILDDNDVDSIRNYAMSPLKISYDGDEDDEDDNDSIHSSLSSLTLPPPTSSTTTSTFLSNLNNLKKLKHNLSVINEESLHEQNERRKSLFNQNTTTTMTNTDDDDDEDDDDEQKGKRLLFDLIRQRLPHHHISLTNTSDLPSKITDKKSQTMSSSSPSSINDQTMREDSSNHGLSSHDITIPSSTMQESGYDSLLPMNSAPKRSLSNASISTTRSITLKKKHRCDEENDDPMNGISNTEMTDDDDEFYDKKAGEALLRNLIAQVLPSFNPRYLNSGAEDEDDEEILSNPRRPSPTSQAYSSSTASSVRSIEIETNKTTTEKTIHLRSNKKNISEILQTEKVHSKRAHIHRPVHQTKSSELRRLQTHSRR